MSQQQFPPTNRKAEADQTLPTLPPTYKSNVTTATYNLSGRDFVRQAGSSLTDTLGVAEKSKVATTNYSKYLSAFLPNSQLCEFC